jgi:hypothetical protein
VVDVRPDNLIAVMDEEKFAATAELCAWHGWAYRRASRSATPTTTCCASSERAPNSRRSDMSRSGLSDRPGCM